jgi:hypothetical protein
VSLVRAPIDAALLTRVLRPYKDGCRYLREAEFEFDPDAPDAPATSTTPATSTRSSSTSATTS